MDTCKEWMKDSSVKCLYWGLVLVLLIMVWWHLTSGAEHLGEWGTVLRDQDNHFRLSLGKEPVDNKKQEWGDALINQEMHEKQAVQAMDEDFQGRRQRNVDSREAELWGILGGGDPLK